MKKFFSILISIVFTIALLVTVLLGIVRSNFKGSNLLKMASDLGKSVAYEVPDNGLYYPGANVVRTVGYEEFDFSSIDLSDVDLTNMDINSIVQQYCEAAGVEVDESFIKEVLKDPETSMFVDKYLNEIMEYTTGAKAELKIEAADVQKVVNNAIDKYEAKTGETVDRTGLNESIEQGVKEAVPELKSAVDEVREENAEVFESVNLALKLLSLKVFIICIAVCVVLALIIILINLSLLDGLKYISVSGIVCGVIIFAAAIIGQGIVLNVELVKAAKDLILMFIGKIKIVSYIVTLVSVVFCVLSFVLSKKIAKNN